MSNEGAKSVLEPAPERASRMRQRQRLIDACISALHIYGPSRTTVERVVALADLSPGIVRFYFESKAAMLVASLEFLASEFEQRVQLPVARLKHTPVRALELLVELYLDSDIASPRKVSVWYSFWGEASSRQEYLQICGKKDEDFEGLVRELMQRMIEESGERHLDADGVALGLMGVLEVLWQSIAFQTETNIDRRGARRRALNYLRSIFPRQFAHSPSAGDSGRRLGPGFTAAMGPARLPAWAYADATLFAAEREQLFRGAWQIAGHVSELARAGDYLAVDLPTERALLLRDESDTIRAFRNSCRRRPHTLLAGRGGTLDGTIDCSVHGLRYGYDGKLRDGETPGDLLVLEVAQRAGLIFVRPARRESEPDVLPAVWNALDGLAGWKPLGLQELELAADWKLVVEQWLESALARHPVGWLAGLVRPPELTLEPSAGSIAWRAPLNDRAPGWSAGHYARVACAAGHGAWRRLFVQPNQLLEIRGDGASVLQVIPESPGRCRVRRLELGPLKPTRVDRVLRYLAQRLTRRWLRQDFDVAGSIQSGLESSEYQAAEAGPVPEALAAFRGLVLALLAGMQSPASEHPPG
ncbi:MAG: TetR family transcriptional regulator C-terminal domain-containing protein [Steroidobacteraceae bacterium]